MVFCSSVVSKDKYKWHSRDDGSKKSNTQHCSCHLSCDWIVKVCTLRNPTLVSIVRRKDSPGWLERDWLGRRLLHHQVQSPLLAVKPLHHLPGKRVDQQKGKRELKQSEMDGYGMDENDGSVEKYRRQKAQLWPRSRLSKLPSRVWPGRDIW